MPNKELTLVQKAAIKVLFGINNAYGIGISGSNGSYCVDIDYDKPKRYVLPMERTKLADGTIAYATLDRTGVWTIKGYVENQSAVTFHATVTKSDIESAPDWVKAIKPVEVTGDD